MLDPGNSTSPSRECRRPSLLEWQPGAEIPGLGPDEVRVWVVELDEGIEGDADVDAVEPGPELAVLSDDERARAARFVRRASDGGSPAAGPRCGRSWAGCWASRPGRCGSAPRPSASPRWIRGRASWHRSASTSRIRPIWRSSPSAGAERSGWTSNGCARSPRPSGSSRRSSRRPRLTRSPRSPSRTAPRPSCGAGPARRPCSKGSAWGSRACRARHETGFCTSGLSSRFTPAIPAPRVDRWMLWEASPRPEFFAALVVNVGDPPLAGG